RAMLKKPVIVAEDGSCTDVCASANAAVAEVGKMVGLCTFLDGDVLDLDEVADLRPRADVGAGSEPGERSNLRASAQACPFDVAVGVDDDLVLDHHLRSE